MTHRRFFESFALLLGFVVALPVASNAQVLLDKSVLTKTRLPPPPQLFSASPGTVSPGTVVTLTGTGLGGVTEVVLVPGHMDINRNNAIVPNPAWQVSKVPAQPVPYTGRGSKTMVGQASSSESVAFSVPLPPGQSQWKHWHPLFVIVSHAGGVDTLGAPLIVDRLPVITRVEATLVLAGQRLNVFGRNLDRVVAGFIGSASKNTPSNPRLAAFPVAWDGTSAYIDTPADCNRDGEILLESDYAPGQFPAGQSYNGPIYVTSGLTAGCGISPQGTAIQPTLSLNGGSVLIFGKGLRRVTDVMLNGTTTSLAWSRNPSTADTEIRVTLPIYAPSVYGLNASFEIPLMLKGPAPILPGYVSPNPRIVFPPKITSVSPGYGAYGMTIALYGSAIFGAPWVIPTVKVGGIVAPLTPQSSGFVVYFTMPADPGAAPYTGPGAGPITIETMGGVDTVKTPFIFVNGPPVINQLDPAAARPGDRITVRGANLAALGGICVGSAGAQLYWTRVGGPYSATSNTEFDVVVPAAAQSGPVGLGIYGALYQGCGSPLTLQFQLLP